MTVKELINELLSCPMGAEVKVLVEVERSVLEQKMNEFPNEYKYPLDDDVEIDSVDSFGENFVRISLAEVE